jgi:HAD superfamily hydrolase (TIGR01509 family)
MDGVLVESGQHHRAAWGALLHELGARVTIEESWRLTIGRPAHEAVRLLLGRALTAVEAMRLARRKRDLYRHLVRRGAVAVPGAAAFVASVSGSGIVAASASRHEAQHVLRTLGLGRHFRAVVTADDVVRGKPDPEVYRKAAEKIGSPRRSASCSRTPWWACRRPGGRACGSSASPRRTRATSSVRRVPRERSRASRG